MKHLALVLALTLTTPSLFAASMLKYEVEPIIGYERVQKLVPTPHTRDRLVYGVRVTAGVLMVSGEAEYTRATDTESFPLTSTSIQDTDDKARIGLRSTIGMGRLLNFVVRAGAQARQTKSETTVAGFTTTTIAPIRYNPYAGAGLRARLAGNVSFTADLTVVFTDFPNMNRNEYMTTAGFAVSFP